MPPKVQELLQNRNVLIGAGGGLLLLIILIVVLSLTMGGGGGIKDPGENRILASQMLLSEKVNIGKAIEIQAVLSKVGVRLQQEPGSGGTVNLMFLPETTLNQRDRAIVTLVQSGLMDGTVGLEVFDNGDLMASREDKRIKLIRAQQGELARLIRKIKPIEDATVKLSIPDPTLFQSERKPASASIQLSIPPGARLTRDKVRAVINLAVGSIEGLESGSVALSDTNGNTYNSVLDSGMELQDKIEEQDQYMKQKVQAQLDRLIGVGKYVVTVSTELREAPRETMVESFDPSQSAVSSKQRFSEDLNSAQKPGGLTAGSGGAVSSFLPPQLEGSATGVTGGGAAQSNKGYERQGVELTYANGKTQWVETSTPGMIEDITVAVTIDHDSFPNTPIADLQQLIARAASPKVNPNNVSIARTKFAAPPALSQEIPIEAPVDPMLTWMPWIVSGSALLIIVAIVFLLTRRSQGSEQQLNQKTQQIEELQHMAAQQQAQLQASQEYTQQMLENQQQQLLATQQASETAKLQDTQRLTDALKELREALDEDDLSPDTLALPLKQWAEHS